MIVNTHDNTESRILIGMVTNTAILGRIAVDWNGKPFASDYANLVGGWCVDHYRKHSSSPGRGIESYYESWAAQSPSEDRSSLVESFLSHLSEASSTNGDLNVEVLVDEAASHFNWVRIERLQEQLSMAIQARNMDKAKESINAHSLLEVGVGMGEEIFGSHEFVQSMFSNDDGKTLINYQQGLREFFRDVFSRESLVAFMGPEKSGKSWWLIDAAFRGVANRKRVAFFGVGDMSLRQITKRFYARIAKCPIKLGMVQYPVKLEKPVHGEWVARVECDERVYHEGLTATDAWTACERAASRLWKSREQFLKVACYPTTTVTVDGIRADLQRWSLRGWNADIVVIDYADILANPPGRLETRDAINKTWAQLKSLTLERHCLVITATQSDADSYEKKLLDRRNFSEDKRKLAHVNGLVGINVTGEEKEKGLTRLNWLVLREREYSPRRVAYVAGCLPLANPAVLSVY